MTDLRPRRLLVLSLLAACAAGEAPDAGFGPGSGASMPTTMTTASGTATGTTGDTTGPEPTTTMMMMPSSDTENPAPMCGDGTVEGGEECDLGAKNSDAAACTSTCKNAACGDGHIHVGVEECDDGNDLDTDDCTSACELAACGDGIVHAGEECDDGNGIDTDDCTTSCALAKCGDGIVGPGEACDDGNANNDDACTTACKSADCGDGVLNPGEECDDGNMVDTDACLSTCLNAKCGDGKVQAGVEGCDDGNQSNLDACTNMCKIPTCNDGIQSGAETDIDCGGGTCADCNKGKNCAVDGDCVTGACVNGTCNLPTSCKQLKSGLPNSASGVYQLDVDGDGPGLPFDVYCEMQVDGGGWILAGRSRNTPSQPGCEGTDGGANFGFSSAQGSVNDNNSAYSLDVAGKGLAFTQVLFGNHSGSKSFAGIAYRHTVVGDFINVHKDTHYFIGEPTTILSPCQGGTSMFNWMGFTAHTHLFHFRDVDGADFGLTGSGWRTCYDNCVGGNLNGQPGMIFVR